jgi:hypothetical protein
MSGYEALLISSAISLFAGCSFYYVTDSYYSRPRPIPVRARRTRR